MAIFYFDAPAGSGKTHVLVEQAHCMARQGQKLLFVQPSRELISRTISEMLQAFHPTYPFRQMTSDTHGGNVVAAIIGHFRDTPRNQGEILFITHVPSSCCPSSREQGTGRLSLMRCCKLTCSKASTSQIPTS